MIAKCLACQCQFIPSDASPNRFECPHCRRAFKIDRQLGLRLAAVYSVYALGVAVLLAYYVLRKLDAPGMGWMAAIIAIELTVIIEAAYFAASAKEPWNSPAIEVRWWILLFVGGVVPVLLLIGYPVFVVWSISHLIGTIVVAVVTAQPKGAARIEFLNPRLIRGASLVHPDHATKEELLQGERIYLAMLAASREFALYAVEQGEITPRTERIATFKLYGDRLTQLVFAMDVPGDMSHVAPSQIAHFAVEAILKRLQTELNGICQSTLLGPPQISAEREAAARLQLAAAVWQVAYKDSPELK